MRKIITLALTCATLAACEPSPPPAGQVTTPQGTTATPIGKLDGCDMYRVDADYLPLSLVVICPPGYGATQTDWSHMSGKATRYERVNVVPRG